MKFRYIFLLLFFPICIFSQNYVSGLKGVATYENIGLYWQASTGSSSNTAEVWYKKISATTWERGHDLWFDDYDWRQKKNSEHSTSNWKTFSFPAIYKNEYRGSIVNLDPGTQYDVEVRLSDGYASRITITTWVDPENLPIVETRYISQNESRTLEIKNGGSPSGYILYTNNPSQSAIVNVNNNSKNCIYINAPYIIVKGIDCKNAKQDGILLGGKAHDIIIDECKISGWGRPDNWIDADSNHYTDTDEFGNPYCMADDAGIAASRGNIERVTIQNCKIFNPRYRANARDEYREHYYPGEKNERMPNGSKHNLPMGPKGIDFHDTKGHLVIRNNHIFATNFEGMPAYRDGISGGTDFTYEGFPNKDTDIYNNIITDCWGQGIQAEGGNCNVRIYSNLIDKTSIKIGLAPVSIGPIYIFYNIFKTSRDYYYKKNPKQYNRGIAIKTGSSHFNKVPDFGMKYFYHNTTIQEKIDNSLLRSGSREFLRNDGGFTFNLIARNNIATQNRDLNDGGRLQTIYLFSKSEDLLSDRIDIDYNLYYGKFIYSKNQKFTDEKNGVKLSNWDQVKFVDKLNNDYSLTPNSAGYGAGIRIYNFNDNFAGKAPDMGVVNKVLKTQVSLPQPSVPLETPSDLTISSNKKKVHLRWKDSNKGESILENGWSFNNNKDLDFWYQKENNIAKIENGKLKIIDNGSSKWTSVTRIINNLEIGKEYYFHDEIIKGTADYVGVYLTSENGNTIYLDYKTNKDSFLDTSFIAKSSSVKLFLQIENNNKGHYGFHDNVTLQKIINKYVGYEVWGREYNGTSTSSWSLQMTVLNGIKNNHSQTLSKFGKYGYKIRLFREDNNNNKEYSDFCNERVISVSMSTISLNDFHSHIKVYLEGAYKDNQMETDLVNNGYLPKNQPFNNKTFEFTTFQKVNKFPNTTVDWLLIELRSDLTTKVKRFSTLLNSDGVVLNLDGTNNFSNLKIPDGKYYLVIHHRNHLSIMSRKKVSIKNSIINYDFSNSLTKAYGTNSMVKLSNGSFAMWSGDSDANKVISKLDFAPVANNILTTGYLQGDIDMNGVINILDYSSINKNISIKSNVP